MDRDCDRCDHQHCSRCEDGKRAHGNMVMLVAAAALEAAPRVGVRQGRERGRPRDRGPRSRGSGRHPPHPANPGPGPDPNPRPRRHRDAESPGVERGEAPHRRDQQEPGGPQQDPAAGRCAGQVRGLTDGGRKELGGKRRPRGYRGAALFCRIVKMGKEAGDPARAGPCHDG